MPISATKRGFGRIFLGLLSLTTFAFAQSVYQAIVSDREFIVLNQVTHLDLLLIIACFNLLPAAGLALLWLGVDRVSPKAADKVLSAAFLLFSNAFPDGVAQTDLSPVVRFHHNTLLLLDPLAVVAVLVFRYRVEFERFLLVLSPVIIIFPALFLWHAWHEVRLR